MCFIFNFSPFFFVWIFLHLIYPIVKSYLVVEKCSEVLLCTVDGERLVSAYECR